MRHLLPVLSILLSSCLGVPECAEGTTLSDNGGCELPKDKACPEDQVLMMSGDCVTPYGSLDALADNPAPLDTDVPQDTGGDTDADTDVWDTDTSQDTDEPSEFGCSHHVALWSGSYPSEIGLVLLGPTGPVLTVEVGELTDADTLYEYTVDMPPGQYEALLIDSAEDGWDGGWIEILHVATSSLVLYAALPSGDAIDNVEFVTTCQP